MAPLVPPPTLWGDVLFAFIAECDDEISLEVGHTGEGEEVLVIIKYYFLNP